jgi:hypothetical protein
MGIDVDVDKSKQNMVFGDECKDGIGMGEDTDILLKAWASTMVNKLILGNTYRR